MVRVIKEVYIPSWINSCVRLTQVDGIRDVPPSSATTPTSDHAQFPIIPTQTVQGTANESLYDDDQDGLDYLFQDASVFLDLHSDDDGMPCGKRPRVATADTSERDGE